MVMRFDEIIQYVEVHPSCKFHIRLPDGTYTDWYIVFDKEDRLEQHLKDSKKPFNGIINLSYYHFRSRKWEVYMERGEIDNNRL